MWDFFFIFVSRWDLKSTYGLSLAVNRSKALEEQVEAVSGMLTYGQTFGGLFNVFILELVFAWECLIQVHTRSRFFYLRSSKFRDDKHIWVWSQGQAYELSYEDGSKQKVYVKRNSQPGAKLMFDGEFASLKAMRDTKTIRVPEPIKAGLLISNSAWRNSNPFNYLGES